MQHAALGEGGWIKQYGKYIWKMKQIALLISLIHKFTPNIFFIQQLQELQTVSSVSSQLTHDSHVKQVKLGHKKAQSFMMAIHVMPQTYMISYIYNYYRVTKIWSQVHLCLKAHGKMVRFNIYVCNIFLLK